MEGGRKRSIGFSTHTAFVTLTDPICELLYRDIDVALLLHSQNNRINQTTCVYFPALIQRCNLVIYGKVKFSYNLQIKHTVITYVVPSGYISLNNMS